ncbi:PDDEXK nuclease domain-containing protein [Segatella copri]|uniref:PDDEXK nuclease domain-containing protein n=1 Tax=Segatella copri TaxID=165179 RepID=UPI003F8A962F
MYIADIQRVVSQSKNRPQFADDFKLLFLIPWDHHRRIIDKCKGNMDKALFFVRKTWENNWGRDVLLNWLDTDLYERDGKAITNFQATLPAVQSDLAQQITKDPYQLDFLNLREKYDEHDIEEELVNNVTRFLLELGKGFSYMGRQFRLEVGQQEFFPDLLFYNAHLHDYLFTFLSNPSVPYENNASERGVRKIKIKQKVSGCFRTDSGADDFAKLHSIAETAMKNGNSKFNAILAVVQQ